MKTTQVQQLKLNVTNISSFLKQSNKKYIGLKKQNSTLFANQVKKSKIQAKEKKIESKNTPKFGLGTAKEKITASGGSIFDKILGFGSLILTGILVNALPKIIETVKSAIDSIVEFVTPIQSAFNIVKGFMTGEFDKNEYDVDKKRVDDKLEELNKSGGLIDQIAEQTGILEPLIKSLKPAIEVVRNVIGGKNKVLAVKGGKEGVLDKGTGTFTERQFTTSERKRFESGGRASSSEAAASSGAEMSSVGSGGGQWQPILELIAKHEAVGGSYDSIYPSTTKPGLSNMTIAEADAWQARTASQRGSAAAGRYQFMYIKDQAASAGIGPNEKFSPDNQDKMAVALIQKKRGISWNMIKNNPNEAMIRLGMEWASLPMPVAMQGSSRYVQAGQSYYAGDGLNRAGATVNEVKRILGASSNAPRIKPNTKNNDSKINALNNNVGGDGSTTIIQVTETRIVNSED